MKLEIKHQSSVTSSDGKININVKNATAIAKALKAAQQLYSAASVQSEYASDLKSLAGILNSAVEDSITKALGGGRIKEGSGGFFPDYVLVEDGELTYRELKLVKLEERVNKEGQSTYFRSDRIKLAGGGGITLSRGVQDITTGFTTTTTTTKSGKIQYSTEAEQKQLNITRFVDTLLAVKDSPEKILRLLESPLSVARALKTTMVAKANSIEIPIHHGGVLRLVSINFDWNAIKKAVLSKRMRISIKPNGTDSISIQVYFNQAIINDALKKANIETLKIIDGPPGNFIKKALAQMAALPSKDRINDIKLFLKQLDYDFAAKYVPGSVIVSRGTVKYNKPKNIEKTSTQKFISGAQWTMLTQRRLGETMKRIGEAYPPDIKERSGRFRASVEVTANYRNRMIAYTYNPLYRSLEHYGYHPEMQVERAIRDVAKELYSYKFHVVRKGALA